jgi:hypothetical protein
MIGTIKAKQSDVLILRRFYNRENWSNLAFGQVMNDPNFVLLRDSWKEQRHFIYFAIDALQNHPLVSLISKEVIQLLPKVKSLS